MTKKYISLIIFSALSVLFISCNTNYEQIYDGPHTLTGAPIPEKIKKSQDVTATADPAVVQGKAVGTISSVNYPKKEVIVNQNNVVELGSVVYVIIDNREILMTVSFPMMSSFKCLIVPNQMKYFKDLKKGMTVYIKQ